MMKSQPQRKQPKLHFILLCLSVFFLTGQVGIVRPPPAQAGAGSFLVKDDHWTNPKSTLKSPAPAPGMTISSMSPPTIPPTAAIRPALAPPAASAQDFTIIVLPDTQYYSKSHPDIYMSQTQWIVDNQAALNIVHVVHEGDIVQDPDVESQWIKAEAAMSLLESATSPLYPDGIPYGVLPGNHDQPTTLYNEYFGVSRFQGREYYGGHYSNKNDNNFTLFSAGGMDFIVINLEYKAGDNVLAWANNLLQTYSDRRGIAVEHSLIDNNGDFDWWGLKTYNALKGNPNLFLMLAGHKAEEGRRQDIFNGNTVHTLLANYQTRTNGGNGWLRIMTFSPTNNQIQVETYSPYLDQFERDANSEFTLYYPMAADLMVSGNVSSTPAVAGAPLSYTLTVANNGPLDATGVALTNTLPAGITFISATPGDDCTEAEGIVSCNLANLAAGDSAQVAIQVTVDPAARGTLDNITSVTGNEPDSNIANNTTAQETLVSAETDLAITKTASSDPVIAGNTLSYTLTITNSGPSNATGVTLDTLPTGATFVSATPSSNCTDAGGIMRCDLANLAAGASTQVAIQVTVDPVARGTLSNIASVADNEFDPNPGNNTVAVETMVASMADLSISQDSQPGPASVGTTLSYELSLSNAGPSSAAMVTVANSLPAGLVYNSAGSSQGNCLEAGGMVTCNLGPLGPGAAATVTIVVTPTIAGTVANTASVVGSEPDPNPNNNVSTRDITINDMDPPNEPDIVKVYLPLIFR